MTLLVNVKYQLLVSRAQSCPHMSLSYIHALLTAEIFLLREVAWIVSFERIISPTNVHADVLTPSTLEFGDRIFQEVFKLDEAIRVSQL